VNKPLRQGQQFFNDIAGKWDDMRSQDHKKISLLINMAGINEGESVLDVGCGTGVLLPFLKKEAGSSGQITAIDFAGNMVARAMAKNRHFTGINYITGDINDYEPGFLFDKIICLNFFPHLSDKAAFIRKMRKMLNFNGSLIIMHDLSRNAVNAVHGTSDTVKNDVLPTVETVSEMLAEAGYCIVNASENDELYFIKATRPKP
jgi:demethylmenaquinone methyltransferase/2-methoxy-6-polyprenyl-1,4-benzoquinol methylase